MTNSCADHRETTQQILTCHDMVNRPRSRGTTPAADRSVAGVGGNYGNVVLTELRAMVAGG
ncbi:hypothetical protein [Nocardia sp. CA-290969]|uniref:hypothetical protein n=1 Tax=Nocardia sp. CA-290969 TaxID=3239986 RepID=UPI003D89FD66